MELLVDFILVSGFIFSLIVIFLTQKSPQKRFTKRILTNIYSLAIIYIVAFYLELHKEGSVLSNIMELVCFGLVLLIGPMLYFYIESIFTTKSHLVKKDYIHFITHPTFWICSIGAMIINEIYEREVIKWVVFMDKYDLFYWFETLVFIGYIIYAILRFYKFRRILLNNFSSIDEKRLAWTKKLLFGLLIVMFVDILSSIIELFIEIQWSVGFITIIAYVFLLIYLAYYGTYKSNIFIPEQMLSLNIDIENKKEEISKEEQLRNEFFKFENDFNQIILTSTPYLDPELNLNSLAQLVGTTDKKLSTFLNQHLNTTFYDFINTKRVEAVKQKLLTEDLQQYSIMGIAFDCGFKSKSSFNRIFKKETGQSPTEYITTHKKVSVL